MTTLFRRSAQSLTLSLMAIVLPASAAPQATPPAKASTAIIPLPLNPVVPAAQRLCTAKTASGLGYSVLRPGTGAKPGASDVVLVNYVGYLAASGIVFDQGMQRPLPIDQVIPGFSEALQTMTRNGVIRFCIPAALGYGAQESGPIPANADLVFQVELLDFKTAAEVAAMNNPGSAEAASPDAPTRP